MGSQLCPSAKLEMHTSTETVATSPFKYKLESTKGTENNKGNESSTPDRETGNMHTRGKLWGSSHILEPQTKLKLKNDIQNVKKVVYIDLSKLLVINYPSATWHSELKLTSLYSQV